MLVIGEQPSKSVWYAGANAKIKRVSLDSLVDALAASGDGGAEGFRMPDPVPEPESFSLGWRDVTKEPFFVNLLPPPAEGGGGGGGGGGGPQRPSSEAMEAFCCAMSAKGAEPLEDWGNGDYVFAGDAWTKFKEKEIQEVKFDGHTVECLAGGRDGPHALEPVGPQVLRLFPGVDGDRLALSRALMIKAGVGGEEKPARVVLTGTFPQFADAKETELQKGKAAVKGLLTRFGGKVSTAISGYVLLALARRPF